MTKKIYSGLIAVLFVSVLVGNCANQKYDFEGTWKGKSGTMEVTYIFKGKNIENERRDTDSASTKKNGIMRGTFTHEEKDSGKKGVFTFRFTEMKLGTSTSWTPTSTNPKIPEEVTASYEFNSPGEMTILNVKVKKQ